MNQQYEFDDPFLTVKDVSNYLKISKAKTYSLIQRGKMPHIKIGKNVRVRYSDLLEWIDSLAFKAVQKYTGD
jgi:excisionase family DNA binding protein